MEDNEILDDISKAAEARPKRYKWLVDKTMEYLLIVFDSEEAGKRLMNKDLKIKNIPIIAL